MIILATVTVSLEVIVWGISWLFLQIDLLRNANILIHLVRKFVFLQLPHLFQPHEVFNFKILIFILQCSSSQLMCVNVHRTITTSKCAQNDHSL